jgi:hypothetical protein
MLCAPAVRVTRAGTDPRSLEKKAALLERPSEVEPSFRWGAAVCLLGCGEPGATEGAFKLRPTLFQAACEADGHAQESRCNPCRS